MVYIILILFSICLGQACKHLCLKFPPVVAEEITYKQFFKSLKSNFKIDIKYSTLISLFMCIYYFNFASVINTVLLGLIFFSLMIVFSVDYRFELIPDECSLFIGYIALIYGILNKFSVVEAVIAAIIGGGIFYLLGKIAMLIFKKEGMGFGDVKLMFVLGMLFGIKNILVVTLLSFFIGAIISCLIMIVKRQGLDSYIPFGPFIVIAAVLLMFFDANIFIDMYLAMCMGLSNVVMDIIYFIAVKE